MYNPSLREEPRYQPAAVIPLKQDDSILEWLEATGRMLARETVDDSYLDDGEEEISELMVDDGTYDLDDDDDDLDLDE